MDEVFKMYAMSADDNSEPAEVNDDHDEGLDEDEEVETSSVLTSSDDDEGVPEETPVMTPARAAKKAPAKKAAKKAPAKKAPAKKAAAKKAPAKKAPAKKAAA